MNCSRQNFTPLYREQAGLRPAWFRLVDLGIRGNSRVMMLEKNSKQIAAVIARWLDKSVSPSKNGQSVALK
jgi:hypothetical protein